MAYSQTNTGVAKPYPKEYQVRAGTQEAKNLLGRAFGRSKKERPVIKSDIGRLKDRAVSVFNKFIRLRDEGQPCISCGKYKKLQAGHYYSAGKHENLRFEEDNVNGQCLQCNYYLSGNLLNYREGLIKKIGIERVERLDLLSRTRITKSDRFFIMAIIKEYGEKVKKY